MITAADVYKRMEAAGEVDQAALDTYIDQVISPKFEAAQTNMIVLTTAMFNTNPLFAGRRHLRFLNYLTVEDLAWSSK